jgi:hypothetical protein
LPIAQQRTAPMYPSLISKFDETSTLLPLKNRARAEK